MQKKIEKHFHVGLIITFEPLQVSQKSVCSATFYFFLNCCYVNTNNSKGKGGKRIRFYNTFLQAFADTFIKLQLYKQNKVVTSICLHNAKTGKQWPHNIRMTARTNTVSKLKHHQQTQTHLLLLTNDAQHGSRKCLPCKMAV